MCSIAFQNPIQMSLSSNTSQALKTLSKNIQRWLTIYESKAAILNKDTALTTRKTQLEQLLNLLTSTTTTPTTQLKDTPLFLKWRSEDRWNTKSSPFDVRFWGAFPGKDFDQSKIKTTASLTFGEQAVVGTIEAVQDWESEGYKCFGYKCEAVWPSDFLSGTITVVIDITYNKLVDQLKRTFEVEGISSEGQAILDFLNQIEVKKELKEEAWEYATDASKKPEEYKTMDQLEPIRLKLKQLIEYIEAIQNTYETFAHKSSLKKMMGVESEELEQHLFGGHARVVWTESCSAKLALDYFESWGLPAQFETTYLTPLKTNLAAIEGKIKVIEEAIKEAETNYQNAKATIEQKSALGGQLLTHIYTITTLDRAFTTLKTNHPDLVHPDGTDAFLLVQKDKATIQQIQDELHTIYTSYDTTCTALVETYGQLYKNYNGKLRDKALATEAQTLKKAAKKDNKEIPAALELQVKGVSKTLKFHAFIFEGIEALLEQANAFYKAVKTGDFYRIKKDFGVIDISGSEPSIKAYNPDFRDETGQDQDTNTSTTTYDHVKHSKLVHKPGTQPEDKSIDPEDVDQGGLEDCYFLSAVASLAQDSPEKIYGGDNAIIQGPNSKGEYTVKLYVSDEDGNPKQVNIQVEPSFVTKTVQKKNAPSNELPKKSRMFAQRSKDDEMWPQLLEKALAQLEGSYSEITGDKKDMSLRGIEILTGKKTNYYKLSKGIDRPIQELVQIYNQTQKVPVAQFGTKNTLVADAQAAAEEEDSQKIKPASGEEYILYQGKVRLYENHAYTLKSIKNTEVGKEIFILRNPHNDDVELKKRGGVEIEINRNQLEQYFNSIIITP